MNWQTLIALAEAVAAVWSQLPALLTKLQTLGIDAGAVWGAIRDNAGEAAIEAALRKLITDAEASKGP